MSVSLLARASMSAAGCEPETILRFFRDPPLPGRVRLPEAGIELPLRLIGPAGWEDSGRTSRAAESLLERLVRDSTLTVPELRESALLVASSSLDVGAFEAARRRGEHAELTECRNALAERLATRFDVRGPRFTLNAACASGAAALIHARRMIAAGSVRHAFVIGSEGLNQLTPAGFAALKLIAPEQCKPFAPQRPGMILGEAVAGVVLGPGSTQDWTIEGSAMNCDPHSPTASTPAAMAEVMTDAMADAGIDAGSLQAVKVHGTGSVESDHAEAHALAQAFPEPPPLTGFKSMLGHTLGASAVLELVVLTQLVDAGWLPGAVEGDVDSQLPLTNLRAPVAPGPGHYLLNTFGFGGNNAALVLRRAAS